MKKVLFILPALFLAACSDNQIKENAEEIIKSNAKQEIILSQELTKENTVLESFLLDSMGIENGDLTIEDSAKYIEYKKKVQDLKDEINYEVFSVQLSEDGNKATVALKVEHYNIGEDLKRGIQNSIDSTMVSIYEGKTITEEMFFDSIIGNAIEATSEPVKENNNIEVSLVKKDESWGVEEHSEDLKNILTLGFYSSQHDILKTNFSVTKENRIFLKTETDIRAIHKEITDFVEENKIDNSEILNHKAAIKERIKESLNISVAFKEDIEQYTIGYDSKKDEIYVSFNDGEENLKLSE